MAGQKKNHNLQASLIQLKIFFNKAIALNYLIVFILTNFDLRLIGKPYPDCWFLHVLACILIKDKYRFLLYNHFKSTNLSCSKLCTPEIQGGNIMAKNQNNGISFFQKYLSIWVALCMIIGVLLGHWFPGIGTFLNQFEYYKVSIPMAILIWIMIYPMMMKVDFKSVQNVRKNPKGLYVTWIINWLIKPFTMYGISVLFFFVIFKGLISPELATQYLAGAVLLGAAPCTAMVFVWSALTKGNPAYTVVQVATNDLIILFAFVPIVKFLLGVSNVSVPYSTLILSVVLFVVVPLTAGILTRLLVIHRHGIKYFETKFIHKFDSATTIGLLLTLIIVFMFQSEVILKNPLHILLIAVPLIIQTYLIFFIAYFTCRILKLPYNIAAPAGMIGASNFFELSVAVAVALFGTTSPAALATTVGVLTEVPVMLTLVKIANKTQIWFPVK